ncbi:MAG: GNAT family N-acetyltransferase [Alphaproteobacteria bacterium]|nr:GNAT family N-acetyltransferase [Alphaproteobacteria bacterium]
MAACAYCDSNDWRLLAAFDAPPPGETDFGVNPYHRSLWRCGGCGHIVNVQDFDPAGLYDAAYWDRTYGGDKMAATFRKIMALPPDKSDNRARVARVRDFADGGLQGAPLRRLLDVGSGLAVFPAAMKEAGWDCTALDPDPRGAAHARALAGVAGVAGDFMKVGDLGRFDAISFNKVLEHVPDPIAMLRRAADFLAPGGFIYVELPDGERAIASGPDREEFFIEHYCAFSEASFHALAERAGFQVSAFGRLVEPSGKYTLYGFLAGPDSATPPGIEESPFEARFLGGPVYRVLELSALDETGDYLRRSGAALVFYRGVPNAAQETALRRAGFRRVETLVTFSKPIAARKAEAADAVRVRPVRPADIDPCRRLAEAGFPFNRFNADPALSTEAASALKAAWIENDIAGRAEAVLIAEAATGDASDMEGGVAGFCAVLLRDGCAVIDLIAVHPAARRSGVGRALVAAAEAGFRGKAEAIRVGTQETNTGSMRFYRALGFEKEDRAETWHWTP